MFNLRSSKKTKWETMEELKNKRLEQKDLLTNELQKIDNEIRAAILGENATDDLMRTKNTILEKVRNVDDEIRLLNEEQSKVQLEHYQDKIKEIDEEIKKKNKELAPHLSKYEEAKKQFAETEKEWFAIHGRLTGLIDGLSRKKLQLKWTIDSMENKGKKTIVSGDETIISGGIIVSSLEE